MFAYNNPPQRKYVYPALVLLVIMLFLLRGLAGEAAPETDLETRMLRQEAAARSIEASWFDSRFGDYREFRNAAPYSRERRLADENLARERREHRQKRGGIVTRMGAGDLGPGEYARLREELRAVDGEHAARERRYEREFRSIDAGRHPMR